MSKVYLATAQLEFIVSLENEMQYLLIDEYGELKLVEEINESNLEPCSWPTVVRLTEIGCGFIQAEERKYDGSWRIIDEN